MNAPQPMVDSQRTTRHDGRNVTLRETVTPRVLVCALTTLALLLVRVPDAQAARDASAEAQFVQLINESRVAAGVGSLAAAADVASVAHAWSVSMAAANDLTHNPLYTEQICCWQSIAENVGYHTVTSSVSETVNRLHSLFMDSDGHRANILNDAFNQVGVGVEISGGLLWVTVNFRKAAVEEPQPAPAPEPKPEPKPEPQPQPKPEPTPTPVPAPPPPPEPAPDPEPSPEQLEAATHTQAHVLLAHLEMLETQTGL